MRAFALIAVGFDEIYYVHRLIDGLDKEKVDSPAADDLKSVVRRETCHGHFIIIGAVSRRSWRSV